VQAALVASEAREVALAARVDAQARVLESLREALQAAEARIASLLVARAEPVAALPVGVPVVEVPVTEVPVVEVLVEAVPSSGSAARAPIDLRRIKGIGPKFAQALAAAGLVDAALIADWSDADIARAASLVGVRPERIVRDDWIGQARALRASS
jgi:NADH-quinone oxidoreductase subunit E